MRHLRFLFVLALLLALPVFADTGTIGPNDILPCTHDNVSTNHCTALLLGDPDSVLDDTYINFGRYSDSGIAAAHNVSVEDDALHGYAFGEQLGWISLNCANEVVNNCGSNGNFHIENDGDGNLSGFAFAENGSWISFWCGNAGLSNCGTNGNYRVAIDENGFFNGYAWVEGYGYIQFDCSPGGEAAGACVETDWRADTGGGDTTGGGGDGNPTDYCPDMYGVQDSPLLCPPDELIDYCPSLPGIQSDPSDCSGTTIDYCPNILGIQTSPADCDVIGPIDDIPDDDLPDDEVPEDTIDNPDDNPDWEDYIIDEIIDTTTHTMDLINATIGELLALLEDPAVSLIVKIINAAVLLGGVLVTLNSLLFANPLSFSEIIFLPLRLWSLLLGAFGLSKRRVPWGTVYDAITKQPLDPAYVVLKDSTGKEITTSITDLDGRYGFLVPAGTYVMTAAKTNYAFPSAKLSGKRSDELYQNLYFGEPFEVKEGEPITKNIPLDPVNFDWNEFEKRKQHLMKYYSRRSALFRQISDTLFAIGLFISFLAFLAAPLVYNTAIFGLYLLLLVLREVNISRKALGGVYEKATGRPLSFAIIRVFSTATHHEVIHKVADMSGKFYCIIPNGDYYATIERKNPDGSYALLYSSTSFHVSQGHIREVFAV